MDAAAVFAAFLVAALASFSSANVGSSHDHPRRAETSYSKYLREKAKTFSVRLYPGEEIIPAHAGSTPKTGCLTEA